MEAFAHHAIVVILIFTATFLLIDDFFFLLSFSSFDLLVTLVAVGVFKLKLLTILVEIGLFLDGISDSILLLDLLLGFLANITLIAHGHIFLLFYHAVLLVDAVQSNRHVLVDK